MSDMDFYDFLGLLGVVVNVLTYAKMQWQREFAKSFAYSFLNFFGSILLIIALLNKWNVAAFMSNFCWALLSVYGMYRCLKYRARGTA